MSHLYTQLFESLIYKQLFFRRTYILLVAQSGVHVVHLMLKLKLKCFTACESIVVLKTYGKEHIAILIGVVCKCKYWNACAIMTIEVKTFEGKLYCIIFDENVENFKLVSNTIFKIFKFEVWWLIPFKTFGRTVPRT